MTIYLSKTIEDESNDLAFKINKTNKNVSLFKINALNKIRTFIVIKHYFKAIFFNLIRCCFENAGKFIFAEALETNYETYFPQIKKGNLNK